MGLFWSCGSVSVSLRPSLASQFELPLLSQWLQSWGSCRSASKRGPKLSAKTQLMRRVSSLSIGCQPYQRKAALRTTQNHLVEDAAKNGHGDVEVASEVQAQRKSRYHRQLGESPQTCSTLEHAAGRANTSEQTRSLRNAYAA